MSGTNLQDAKAQAAARYTAIGEEWMKRFGVTLRSARRNLTGCHQWGTKEVDAPWPPTTRKRLYVLAHEIGHAALDHRGSRPVYVREFEAEQFAHGLMRQSGIAVPRTMTMRAKAYVQSKMRRGFARGATWFDPDIAQWAGASVLSINFSAPPIAHRPHYAVSLRRVERALAASEGRAR